MKLSIYGESNDGRQRDHNEDSFIIFADRENLWAEVNNQTVDTVNSRGVICVVADGMGGANAGEIASELAVKTVEEGIQKIASVPESVEEIEKLMVTMILTGHKRILKAAGRNSETEGMGTTLIIAWIINHHVYIAWSGDSRCYLYRPNESQVLRPFTNDHSLVWERVKSGEITAEEARLSDESNLILQSLGGSYQKPEPDFKWGKISQHDRILICSDGLNSMLSDLGIQQILEYEKNTNSTCRALVDSANNAGGHDNITVVIVDILEDEEGTPEPDPPMYRKRKRISWKFLVFPLVVLLILAGYFIRNEVGSKNNSATPDQQPEELESTAEGYASQEDPLPDHSKAKSAVIDTIKVHDVLRRATEELLLVKKHLLIAEQSENISFAKENGVALDLIYRQFASLDSSIQSVATYKINSMHVEISGFEVYDFPKANRIHLEVLDACRNLKTRTENLIIHGK